MRISAECQLKGYSFLCVTHQVAKNQEVVGAFKDLEKSGDYADSMKA